MAIYAGNGLYYNGGYGSELNSVPVRIWANINGGFYSSGNPSFRSGHNASSVTDITQGHYRINFTITLPDTNYAMVCNSREDTNGGSHNRSTEIGRNSNGMATTHCEVQHQYTVAGGLYDSETTCVMICR